MHVNQSHWEVIIAHINYDKGTIKAFFYDPLVGGGIDLELVWIRQVVPFILRWHDAVNDQRKQWNKAKESELLMLDFPELTSIALKSPCQPDGSSCGVMIVAQAYAVINKLKSFVSKERESEESVEIMRLRILWLLLAYTTTRTPVIQPKMKKIHEALQKIYGDKTPEWNKLK